MSSVVEKLPLERIERYLTRRRMIAAVLVILAVFVDAVGFYIAAPAFSSPPIVYESFVTVYYNSPTYGYFGNSSTPPAVWFQGAYVFSAYGALSVNNPVHVHVDIKDVNDSPNMTDVALESCEGNFLNCYASISFTDAFYSNVSSAALDSNNVSQAKVPLTPGAQYRPPSCPAQEYCPPQQSCPSGGWETWYCADADLVWLAAGASYSYLLPSGVGLTYSPLETRPVSEGGLSPVVTISDVSDTLSVQANKLSLSINFVIIGFTIVLLLDIIDTLFTEPTKEVVRRRPLPPPPPTSE